MLTDLSLIFRLIVEDSNCAAESRPVGVQKCNTSQVPECGPSWHYSEWSDVSVSRVSGRCNRSKIWIQFSARDHAAPDYRNDQSNVWATDQTVKWRNRTAANIRSESVHQSHATFTVVTRQRSRRLIRAWIWYKMISLRVSVLKKNSNIWSSLDLTRCDWNEIK